DLQPYPRTRRDVLDVARAGAVVADHPKRVPLEPATDWGAAGYSRVAAGRLEESLAWEASGDPAHERVCNVAVETVRPLLFRCHRLIAQEVGEQRLHQQDGIAVTDHLGVDAHATAVQIHRHDRAALRGSMMLAVTRATTGRGPR